MFDEIPQKNAIILWDEEEGAITRFLVLYEFLDKELQDPNCCGDNSKVDTKSRVMSHSAGNVYANWMDWTPAFIIFNFLVLERFCSKDRFLMAFDELMKINEVREDLLKATNRDDLYKRIEQMAFTNRFPWARLKNV